MAYSRGSLGRWDGSNEPFDSTWILDDYKRYEPVRQMLLESGEPDELYFDKLQDIFSGALYYGVPPEPTMITAGVYLGTQANAENLDLLRRMKITHVLNCAGLPESLRHARARRYAGTGVSYDELAIDDSDRFNILGFFGRANTFIDHGRMRGRVLIHCTGVSRSGAIALAYMMRMGKKLLDSARALKEDRRVALCNEGFMKNLVDYARAIGRLDPEPGEVRVARYGRAIDRPRIFQAHLPDYLSKY